MTVTMIVLVVLGGLYVGGNIGANDAANCIGASVGAGLMRYRSAIILVAVCVIAGALLQGGDVVKTVGKGIVTDPISPLGVLAALLCGGLFVSLATFFRIPVSTSQSVVGAVAGVGVAGDLTVKWAKLMRIGQCWVFCPLLTMVLTNIIYRLLRWGLRNLESSRKVEQVLTVTVVLTAGYAAYSLGANNLGNAIGPIVALETEILDRRILTVAGALSMAMGALLFGRGVAETVGRDIIPLDLRSATAVQVSSAFGLHLFSMMGIPVSTSQSIIGALLGIGMVHGIKTVSMRKIVEVMVGWVAVPSLSGIVSFLFYSLLTRAL